MSISLPDDILHMICIELWHQRDFNTLFNFAVSSKQLAAPALINLYRMHDVAPVTNGGSDEVEVARPGKTFDTIIQQQGHTVHKWARLWRTMILSSLGKTAFPYCRYIRALNLRDLKELLEDWKFRGAVSSEFFDGELSQFNIETEAPVKPRGKVRRPQRLNSIAVLHAIGEVMTQRTSMVDELSGEISCDALSRWIPRLPRLQQMTLWRGAALEHTVGNLLHVHCPSFKTLRFYEWLDQEADYAMASFLFDLRPQSLESLEVFSYSNIAAETFVALNSHRESLQELKLNNIKSEAISALSLLKHCTSLTSLLLSESHGLMDLEKTHNDVFLEVVSWLRECKGLKSVAFQKMPSASAILTPVLLENSIRLVKLELEGYQPRLAQDFHRALGLQDGLRSVWLKGEGEDFIGDDIDLLVDSLCKLTHLNDLRLRDVSDYFRDEHICRLACNLADLREWWTSGYGITDAIWPDVARLKSLRRLEISAWTSFTTDGLLGYIAKLGSGNNGMILSVMMADPEGCSLTEEEQSMVRDCLASQVEGRFDYILARDPDISEFEGDSD